MKDKPHTNLTSTSNSIHLTMNQFIQKSDLVGYLISEKESSFFASLNWWRECQD